MLRAAGLVALLLAMAVLAAGCGVRGSSTEVLPTIKAPPQTAELGWIEPFPADQPVLVFGVESFAVTEDGWRAEISVQNRSDVSWQMNTPELAADLDYGVRLFPTGDHGELDRRSQQNDLPALRPATSYAPAPPKVLLPGKTWRGTIAAPGALAGGLWVRISFGPFVSEGDPPTGIPSSFGWNTDHAYHLQVVGAAPA